MFVALLSSGEYIQLEEGESDVSIWQVPDDFAFDQGGEVERIARDGQDCKGRSNNGPARRG